MIEEISRKFGWTHMTLFYEKNFWKSELLESGFCKMLMNVNFSNALLHHSLLSYFLFKNIEIKTWQYI